MAKKQNKKDKTSKKKEINKIITKRAEENRNPKKIPLEKEKKIKRELELFLLGETDLSLNQIRQKFDIGKSTLYRIKEEVEKKLIQKQVEKDLQEIKLTNTEKRWKKKYTEAVKMLEQRNSIIEDLLELREYQPNIMQLPFDNKENQTSNKPNAIPIGVISDVHIEEIVDPETISNINEYNLEIAQKRISSYFIQLLKEIQIVRETHTVSEMILANLGDNFSGYIHEELVEENPISPTQAVMLTLDWMISGINYLLKHGKFNKLTVLMIAGNHSRNTKFKRISTFYKNNYEWMMGHLLKKHFRDNNKVNIIVPKTELYYMTLYNDYVIRFLHGDLINYRGGVGGVFIPANKAIAQWDKSKRANLTIMGHFHTFRDIGNLVVNGSVIGYNAYAQNRKFDPEPPTQALVVIDDKKRKILTKPIFLEEIDTILFNLDEEIF